MLNVLIAVAAAAELVAPAPKALNSHALIEWVQACDIERVKTSTGERSVVLVDATGESTCMRPPRTQGDFVSRAVNVREKLMSTTFMRESADGPLQACLEKQMEQATEALRRTGSEPLKTRMKAGNLLLIVELDPSAKASAPLSLTGDSMRIRLSGERASKCQILETTDITPALMGLKTGSPSKVAAD